MFRVYFKTTLDKTPDLFTERGATQVRIILTTTTERFFVATVDSLDAIDPSLCISGPEIEKRIPYKENAV